MRRLLIPLMFCVSFFTFVSCSQPFKIIDKPISFSEERIELTKNYIQEHYGFEPEDALIIPNIIVLHWTANNNFDSCFAIFNNETLNNSRPDLIDAGNVNVSVQFMVSREGKIFRLMPELMMARHCIGLNYSAIGIENVGGNNNIDDLTEEQVEANVFLVKYLAEKYPSIEYLIGHHEYRKFEKHPLWLEMDSTYRTEKHDPGKRFMNLVRKGVSELELMSADEVEKEAAEFNEQ